jgi:DHA2 family methylenomycin A resistance protein-like MFS transporter
VFGGGLILFGVASGICALAPSVESLVGARVVQGIGAALLVPSSLALLRAAYHTPAERARAVGLWGMIAGVGAASGPILGGVLVGLISWRAVFIVNLPVCVAAAALAAGHLPAPGKRHDTGLDPRGQLLGICSLLLLTFGLIEGGAAGWTSRSAVAPLIAVVPTLVAFIVVERRSDQPMLPLSLFHSRTLTGASFVGLAINLGFYGQLFALSLYFQRERHLSPLLTGLALLPQGAVVALSSAVSGRITAQRGPRRPMLAGLLCGASGFGGLILAGPTTSYLALVVPLVAAGSGMAFTMPAATAAVIESAPAERAGIASGVLNAARQTGGAIGVAVVGTLLAGISLTGGVRAAMAVSATSFAAAAIVTAATVPEPPR